MNLLKKLFRSKPQPIIIVSGLPRSGTSMMMKMLDATGIEIVTDRIREANEDNPKGYYEFERVKKLPEGDTAWLADARGKAVKVISALLMHLPANYPYRVLFMRRKMHEILASQKKMLDRRSEAAKTKDEEMAALFEKHLAQVYAWLNQQPNVTYVDVDYNAMLADPRPQLQAVQALLERDLDLDSMAAIVDPDLYRQRR